MYVVWSETTFSKMTPIFIEMTLDKGHFWRRTAREILALRCDDDILKRKKAFLDSKNNLLKKLKNNL